MLAQKLTTAFSKSFTPATLSLTAQTVACATSRLVTSSQITITGPSEYVLTASPGVEFSINGGAYTTAGTAVSGNKFVARVTSQSSVNTFQANYVYVGDGFGNNKTFTFSTDTANFKIIVINSTFVVPVGVTSISMLCVGASGAANNYNPTTLFGCGGGGGGALSYTNNVAVSPGESLTVICPSSGGTYNYGTTPPTPMNAVASEIKRGSTTLVKADSGKSTIWQPSDGAPGVGGSSANGVGAVKFSGGSGGYGGSARKAGYGGSSAKMNANGTNGGTATNSSYIAGGNGIDFVGLSGVISYTSNSWTSGGEGNKNGGGSSSRTDSLGLGARNDGASGIVVLAWGGRTFGAALTF